MLIAASSCSAWPTCSTSGRFADSMPTRVPAPDAETLQRLHELTGRIAHLADGQHGPAEQLQQRTSGSWLSALTSRSGT